MAVLCFFYALRGLCILLQPISYFLKGYCVPSSIQGNPTDFGADDFNEEDDSFEIITSPDALPDVVKALEENKIPMAQSEVTMLPQNYIKLEDETAIKNLQRTLDMLDEDDDVQYVYTNWDEED